MDGYKDLETNWFLKKPIDLEHKQYVLNYFLKRVEESLSLGEVYPFFSLVSLHLCSLGHFSKSGKILKLKNKILEFDTEISIHDLKEYKPRTKMSENELIELQKIVKYSQEKLTQYFTICKTIWQFSFESTSVKLRKIGKEFDDKFLFLYKDIYSKEYTLWEFEYQKNKKGKNLVINKLLTEKLNHFDLMDTLSESDPYKNLSIIEGFCTQNLPIENTLLPLFKRKIQIIFQKSLLEKYEELKKNFDKSI
jgi:hypothetical protein